MIKKFFLDKYRSDIYYESYSEGNNYIAFRTKFLYGYLIYFFDHNKLYRYKDSLSSNRDDDFIEDLTCDYFKYKRLLKLKFIYENS